MKKTFCIYIMVTVILVLASLPVSAVTYEGEVVAVDTAKQTLTLAKVGGERQTFKLAPQAELFFNNDSGTLAMYGPVTENDYVSGYVETNTQGLIKAAHFYYLVREGTIATVSDDELVLQQTEYGIYDTFEFCGNAQIYLNNYPTELAQLQKGMKALVILDHHHRVKKMAVFHYEYTGFIETLDLRSQTVVVNIGTRLRPDRREFHIGGILQGACSSWESLAAALPASSLIFAKFSLDQARNTISFAEIRKL